MSAVAYFSIAPTIPPGAEVYAWEVGGVSHMIIIPIVEGEVGIYANATGLQLPGRWDGERDQLVVRHDDGIFVVITVGGGMEFLTEEELPGEQEEEPS